MGDTIWDDVAFDHSAANDAVAVLERAASQLERASTARAGQARAARQDWSGATRAQFDQTLDPALGQAGDLAVALRRAEGTIRQAITDATAEQQRRLKVRADYRAQGDMRPV
ncbi:MAG: hypothetical protein ACRDTT_06800 [Pseudonocardiaceae bacterium]